MSSASQNPETAASQSQSQPTASQRSQIVVPVVKTQNWIDKHTFGQNDASSFLDTAYNNSEQLAALGIKIRDFAFEKSNVVCARVIPLPRSPVLLNKRGHPLPKRSYDSRPTLMDFRPPPRSQIEALSQPIDMTSINARLDGAAPRANGKDAPLPVTEPSTPEPGAARRATPVAAAHEPSPILPPTRPDTPMKFRSASEDAALAQAEAIFRVEQAHDLRKKEQKEARRKLELLEQVKARKNAGLSPIKVTHTIEVTIQPKEEPMSPVLSSTRFTTEPCEEIPEPLSLDTELAVGTTEVKEPKRAPTQSPTPPPPTAPHALGPHGTQVLPVPEDQPMLPIYTPLPPRPVAMRNEKEFLARVGELNLAAYREAIEAYQTQSALNKRSAEEQIGPDPKRRRMEDHPSSSRQRPARQESTSSAATTATAPALVEPAVKTPRPIRAVRRRKGRA